MFVALIIFHSIIFQQKCHIVQCLKEDKDDTLFKAHSITIVSTRVQRQIKLYIIKKSSTGHL